MGYPWTPLSIARACLVQPLNSLQAATHTMVSPSFQGWPPIGQAACGLWLSYYPLGYSMAYGPISKPFEAEL
jgi:hypothetical protein